MENGTEKKKRGIFWIVFSIYTLLLIVVVIVVNVKVWDALEIYQKDYESAEAAANPDLIMPELMGLYASSELDKIAPEGWADGISTYELESNVEKYVEAYTSGKIISYERNDKFSDRKPVYDIYSGDQLIGMVTLKQKPESDNHGFHLCELKEAVAYVEQPQTLGVTIEVLADDKVMVNGKELTDEYIIGDSKISSTMGEQATALTGKAYMMQAYHIDGFLEAPTIEVYRKDVKVECVREEGYDYDYITLATPELADEVEDLVLAASEAYIMNTNQWANFKTVAQYIETSSKAYQTVKSVQSGLAWAGKPDKIEIQESIAKDYVQYSESVFTVKTSCKVYRLYRDVEYNEEVAYEWLYMKIGNEWKICDFSLAK